MDCQPTQTASGPISKAKDTLRRRKGFACLKTAAAQQKDAGVAHESQATPTAAHQKDAGVVHEFQATAVAAHQKNAGVAHESRAALAAVYQKDAGVVHESRESKVTPAAYTCIPHGHVVMYHHAYVVYQPVVYIGCGVMYYLHS